MDKKSKTLVELEKLAGISTSTRKEELTKMAYSAMDRRTLNKEIQKAQKELSRSRKEYQDASGILSDVQSRADEAKRILENSSRTLIQLTQLSRDMDLSGADSISPQGDEFAYVINGRRHHVDTSDVNDVKIQPWKEYLKSKELSQSEENTEIDLDDLIDMQMSDDVFDLSKEAKIESKVIKKIAKRFR